MHITMVAYYVVLGYCILLFLLYNKPIQDILIQDQKRESYVSVHRAQFDDVPTGLSRLSPSMATSGFFRRRISQ